MDYNVHNGFSLFIERGGTVPTEAEQHLLHKKKLLCHMTHKQERKSMIKIHVGESSSKV